MVLLCVSVSHIAVVSIAIILVSLALCPYLIVLLWIEFVLMHSLLMFAFIFPRVVFCVRFINIPNIVLPFNSFSFMSNFQLSPRLREFINYSQRYFPRDLGESFPISIRKKYSFSQSILIFPDEQYNFFIGSELSRFIRVAHDMDLELLVCPHYGIVVIEVTEYFPDC